MRCSIFALAGIAAYGCYQVNARALPNALSARSSNYALEAITDDWAKRSLGEASLFQRASAEVGAGRPEATVPEGPRPETESNTERPTEPGTGGAEPPAEPAVPEDPGRSGSGSENTEPGKTEPGKTDQNPTESTEPKNNDPAKEKSKDLAKEDDLGLVEHDTSDPGIEDLSLSESKTPFKDCPAAKSKRADSGAGEGSSLGPSTQRSPEGARNYRNILEWLKEKNIQRTNIVFYAGSNTGKTMARNFVEANPNLHFTYFARIFDGHFRRDFGGISIRDEEVNKAASIALALWAEGPIRVFNVGNAAESSFWFQHELPNLAHTDGIVMMQDDTTDPIGYARDNEGRIRTIDRPRENRDDRSGYDC